MASGLIVVSDDAWDEELRGWFVVGSLKICFVFPSCWKWMVAAV